jgi:hypothetical protein
VNFWKQLSLFLLFFISHFAYGQINSLRHKTVAPTLDVIPLDSLTIYPNSFQISVKGQVLPRDAYQLSTTNNTVQLIVKQEDSISITYRVLPFNLNKTWKLRDTSIVFNENKGDREKYLIQEKQSYEEVFGSKGIQKNGSISRGLSFGNNQNVSLNSSLNLELSGEIASNLKLMASITDNNIPVQPEGNTSKLQEFDQVFIQVYNDRFKLIAGDFWMTKPSSYFMTYRKRGQGLKSEYEWSTANKSICKISGAVGLSKGKYARQIIQGVEGNQGPYRLKGNENEPFIVILSGTESVFIDGKQLTRGQENDYLINYNTSEITFTSRKLITKDSRIVIEFQYTDQNYARSIVVGNASIATKKYSTWISIYSEQDAKNQPLQQSLSDNQKLLLSSVGDSVQLARSLSVDSIGFQETQNLYKKVDSLNTKDVLVFTADPQKAVYQCTFSYVGENKGNYVLSSFNALGKIYVWKQPINGIPQGNYEPVRLLIAPKQKQMTTAGISYVISKNFSIETESAITKNNINTFSLMDTKNDQGFSNRSKIIHEWKIKHDSTHFWTLKSSAEMEYLSVNFSPIEQYRSVEFDRDWNTRSKGFIGRQMSTSLSEQLTHSKYGFFAIDGTRYIIGNEYEGLKSSFNGNWNKKGFASDWTSSYLKSNFSSQTNTYVRHKLHLNQSFGKIKIGYKDDQEQNVFSKGTLLQPQSYGFYDYQFYLSNVDSTKVNYTFSYRERYDHRSDSTRLSPVAKAKTFGFAFMFKNASNHRLQLITNYRSLRVSNPKLINQSPENTLIGRIEYDVNKWKGTLNWNVFYEISSGLEVKKEFVYIKVNDGQGVYTWIDYNNNGVKDLNEFEVAQFIDQASYIRVFTPSNEYVKTYSNELNQSIFLKPDRIWNNKTGVLHFLGRFSNQLRMRLSHKDGTFDPKKSFNPFAKNSSNVSLISTISTLRNTVYFNRTSAVFGAEYNFQSNQSKSLLASGFDAREDLYHELNIRFTLRKAFIFETSLQKGSRKVNADYTIGRNFEINYQNIKPSINYQPSTQLRYTVETRFAQKNALSGENAIIQEVTLRAKYNHSDKGSLQASLSSIQINYTGIVSSAIGFELLESLKPGKNNVWTLSYQRTLSKKLQMSLQYNGRRSEGGRTIHSGGMEVRAYF